MQTHILIALLAGIAVAPAGAATSLDSEISARAQATAPQVIAWRRQIHADPELSNEEEHTAALVAGELRNLGMEVQTGIAHHGVVGLLRGGKPGGVVALRADMDALPVEEATGLPFASHKTVQLGSHVVHVAHACGHDAHTAMLLGAAAVLTQMRQRIPGSVKFIFQPAEEDHPANDGGARLMIARGALANPAPTAIFGLHVRPGTPGTIYYTSGATMAGSDDISIVLTGKQTHGAMPWAGIDTITLSAQIIEALNGISSRQLDPSAGPNVITIATLRGSERSNIIPETVSLGGVLRTLNTAARDSALVRIRRTVTDLADSWGAKAGLSPDDEPYPVTFNDPTLTARMLPALARAAGGESRLVSSPPVMASEDFAFYQQKIPGVYFFLGISPDGVSMDETPPNHSPYFTVNEAALAVGVKAHVTVALNYLEQEARRR
ncbi:MAG: amidohydrolase [Proteobacteria bacterium]|nr:amidohydrolase [Pseudomonadota bacterium]